MIKYRFSVTIDTSLGEVVYHIIAQDVPNVLRILRGAMDKKAYEIISILRNEEVIDDNPL